MDAMGKANERVDRDDGEGDSVHEGHAIKRGKHAWKTAFLAALSNTAIVRAACRSAGVSWKTAYVHRRTDAAFAVEWDEALEEAADVLEAEARRRAVHGAEKVVIYKGQVSVGPDGKPLTVKEYSDTLLIF